MTSDTSGVNNPVYGGEDKPKKKKQHTMKQDHYILK